MSNSLFGLSDLLAALLAQGFPGKGLPSAADAAQEPRPALTPSFAAALMAAFLLRLIGISPGSTEHGIHGARSGHRSAKASPALTQFPPHRSVTVAVCW